MTPEQREELKAAPCPFCGNKEPRLDDCRLQWIIVCDQCSACVLGDRSAEPDGTESDEYWFRYLKSAFTAWNRRAQVEALTVPQSVIAQGMKLPPGEYTITGNSVNGSEPNVDHFEIPAYTIFDLWWEAQAVHRMITEYEVPGIVPINRNSGAVRELGRVIEAMREICNAEQAHISAPGTPECKGCKDGITHWCYVATPSAPTIPAIPGTKEGV